MTLAAVDRLVHLLQAFYSIRSERQLMEQLDYDLLFRWFVGLSMDAPVWDASTFSKNRERFLEGDVAQRLLTAILDQPRVQELMSDEHVWVDGTLIQAWALHKSFQPRPPDDKGNGPAALAATAPAAQTLADGNQEREWRGRTRINEYCAVKPAQQLLRPDRGTASLRIHPVKVRREPIKCLVNDRTNAAQRMRQGHRCSATHVAEQRRRLLVPPRIP